jgi:metal-responsive CopG/Arc/MetJ family transcriptional regulator
MSIYFSIDYLYPINYMNGMATNKPQILLTIDENLLKRIEDFRFENRINTRSEAIRRLLEEAVSRYEKKSNKK